MESSFEYDKPRFGAKEQPENRTDRGGWILKLATGLQKEPPYIFKWVLWREAILSLLQPRIRQITEAADIGLFGGLKYGIKKPKQREHLKKIWQQISPPQYYPYYQYNAVLGFPMFDNVVDGEFLQRVIPWLNTMHTIYQTPIASTTYTAALERWMLETHRPLTFAELRILKALSINPALTQTELSKQLKITPSNISQTLSGLAKNHILRLFNFINLPLIGLARLGIIFHVPSGKTRPLSKWLSQIRYIHSIRHLSETSILVYFLIPRNHVNDFNSWIEKIYQKWNLSSPTIHCVTDILHSRSFQNYIPEVGWPDDFSPILDTIKCNVTESSEIKQKSLQLFAYSYKLAETRSDFPLELNPEDFAYFRRATEIASMTNRIISRSSEEAREAGLTETKHMRYRRRISRLEELGVSALRGFSLLHVDLNTNIEIILLSSRERTEQFLKEIQLLPYLSCFIFDDGMAEIVLHTPNSVSIDIYSSLSKILAENDYDAIVSARPAWQAFVGFPSPIVEENYNFEKGEWVWDRDLLPEPSFRF
jgi:DNA-binding Lrp family transcriptional regulator